MTRVRNTPVKPAQLQTAAKRPDTERLAEIIQSLVHKIVDSDRVLKAHLVDYEMIPVYASRERNEKAVEIRFWRQRRRTLIEVYEMCTDTVWPPWKRRDDLDD